MEKPKVIILPNGEKAVDLSNFYLTTFRGRVGLLPKDDLSGDVTPASLPEDCHPQALINLLISVMHIRDQDATELILSFLL